MTDEIVWGSDWKFNDSPDPFLPVDSPGSAWVAVPWVPFVAKSEAAPVAEKAPAPVPKRPTLGEQWIKDWGRIPVGLSR